MKMKKIKVLVVPVGEKPQTQEVNNDLATFQKLVGGYIEIVALTDRIMLVCNENAKLEGLEGNRRVGRDIIAGNFFVAADNGKSDFESLTDDEMKKLYSRFEQPEHYTAEEVEETLDVMFEFHSW